MIVISRERIPEHRTAGVIVIGNEILSGKVRDENSPFLASELRRLGVSLRRIDVVPDEIDLIAEATARHSRSYDFVFTSGGVGPTHDDRTIEGVATAFGQRVVRNALLVDLLKRYYGPRTTEVVLKMADVPEEAEIFYDDGIQLPVVTVRNVTVFPGVPDLLRQEFLSIQNRFATAPFISRRVYLRALESDIAPVLDKVEQAFQQVDLGSYPVFDVDLPYKVMLTFDSKNAAAVDAAIARLLEQLPSDHIQHVE